MRRKARADANQPEIVSALRHAGATVIHTHTVGKGFVDIVVGFRNQTYLMELKDGSKKPSARVLTEDEFALHTTWRGGPLVVVSSVDEALEAIGASEQV
jgi:Holliday junction resolvase